MLLTKYIVSRRSNMEIQQKSFGLVELYDYQLLLLFWYHISTHTHYMLTTSALVLVIVQVIVLLSREVQ